ncbi:MAG: hypothetical protein A3I05_08535 [Deltaproteobacteria bacterium RIFCSPLOWO2_02_FULL_44_10]|nr:MAG: hypothetical protein A3C46_05580 [Deltaproteobacteria bacterium RIFCSPHIGHO2_02_FULL_44_16]OGQ45543.1 MAG: hypothetical protein A3I05_08535 [Deltaproteobacteria bacterium RIFCSPLOWO2_02_FULL_44_10]
MIQPHDEHVVSALLFKHSSLGLIICDDKGEIIEVNPHACSLFGYEPRELVGQKIEALIPHQFRKKHVEHRARYYEHPVARPMGIGMDLLALKKNGTEFPVEISLASYEIDERRWTVGFVSDITERKKIKDELKQLNITLEHKVGERTRELSQALMELHHINTNLHTEMAERKRIAEELNVALEKERELGELKSRFVSLASHEFRTPLGGIASSASLITKYQKEKEQEQRDKHVRTIQRLVQHLTSILNDFLSMDKLEQGNVEAKPSSLQLASFVESCINDTERGMSKKNRIVYVHEGDMVTVMVDQEMLRNIVTNLISNALKYSSDETIVSVKTRVDGEKIELIVEDQGIGIPEVDQKRLFERFHRGKNVLSVPGTGIGLNIVKNYLDLMGGSIRFESEEGKGTTFVVILPKGERT